MFSSRSFSRCKSRIVVISVIVLCKRPVTTRPSSDVPMAETIIMVLSVLAIPMTPIIVVTTPAATGIVHCRDVIFYIAKSRSWNVLLFLCHIHLLFG